MKFKNYPLLILASAFWLAGCNSKATELATNSKPDSTQTDTASLASQVDDIESSEAGDADQALALTDAESGWGGTYSGKLDGRIEVSLELHGLRDDVRGTITYKKSAKPIMVLGTMNTDGTFYLREYQPDGNVTGVLSGTEKGKKLTGSWYAPGAEKELGGDDVEFTFNCITGGPGYNMAMVEKSTATVSGGELTYKLPEFACKFKIRFYDGFATVRFLDEQYDCGFGHNATIEGEFVKLK